ncbi:MAG: sulfite exporter TauE/SafE family protein [Fluviicola sp.]|jgi:uncharacterized membrane protein YfcA
MNPQVFTPQILIILFVIGFFAGTLSGFVGVGGGIIIVPALFYFANQSWSTSVGTSLFILAMPVVIFGLMNYWKVGNVNWKYGLVVASTFIVGGYVGSKINQSINPSIVKIIFGIIMIFSATMLIRGGIKDFKNGDKVDQINSK